MTRTHIIAADGTRFVPVGRGARIARRIIAGAFLIITALFLSAAVIGLQRAAIDAPRPAPVATQGISLKAAQVACRKAPRGAMQDCLNLFMRHAWSTANSYTPEGAILVRDCISQYRGAELADCFTQEIG